MNKILLFFRGRVFASEGHPLTFFRDSSFDFSIGAPYIHQIPNFDESYCRSKTPRTTPKPIYGRPLVAFPRFWLKELGQPKQFWYQKSCLYSVARVKRGAWLFFMSAVNVEAHAAAAAKHFLGWLNEKNMSSHCYL